MSTVRRIVICLMFLSTQAFATQWYEAYEEGRKQVDKGNCGKGIPLIQQALQKQPKEDARAHPYGVITVEYVPRYYLLKCAMQSGDMEAAGRYIKEADEAGQVTQSKKASDYNTLKKQFTDQQKLALKEKSPPEKQVDVKPVEPPPAKQDTVPKEDPAAKQRQLELQRQAEIQRAVAEAQQHLFSNRPEEARRAAQRALTLDPGNDRARTILEDIQQQESALLQARREKQQQLQAIQGAINSGNLAVAENLALQYQQQYPEDTNIKQTIAEIRKRKSAPPPPPPQPTESPLKSTEKLVLIAFLKGNYEAVIQLVEINESKFRESWRLPYYQGCAYASLAMLDEKRREEQIQMARNAFRKAKQRSGSIPDNPYVSPKILEIFRSS